MTAQAACACRCADLLVASEGQVQCRCQCRCCGASPISREREVAELEALRARVPDRGGSVTEQGGALGRRVRPRGPRLDVRHKLAVVAVVVLAVPVVALAHVASSPGARPSASPGRPAPVFALPLLGSGDQFGTRELEGKLVVVTFWASWCEPCSVDARLLEDAWRRHRDRGLVVLGVNLDEDERDALRFVRRHGLTYPNVRDFGTVAGAFGLAGMPETYFVAENWTIESVYRGFELALDQRHGVALRDALYPPILERRIAALFATRSGPSSPTPRRPG